MLSPSIEASLPVLLPNDIEKESDIKKLTWEEIQSYGNDGGMYVTIQMQKTKDIVHNPISEEALELIGYSPDKRGKVFPDFKDSMTQAPLKNWLKEGCMDSCKGSMFE